MEESSLIIDLAIAFGAALCGGVIARVLKQSAILGYLVAGIIIGPHALALIEDADNIQVLATIGVVLFLFTLGIEFSFRELRQVRNTAIFGGIAQIAATTGLGILVAMFLLGQSLRQAIVFGFLIALSSTMVVAGMLVDRGETNSVHGRAMIGILLLQDVAAAFAMFILPILGEGGGGLLPALGIALAKAAAFAALVFVGGILLIPRLLKRVALRESRDLFVLGVVALCLGGAFGAYYFGLSAALGALAIGLMVSLSDFAHQALGDMMPLRALFLALFFVSIGMLIDLHFLALNIVPLLILVAVIVLGKFVICSGVGYMFGYRGKTVPLIGAGMIQVGEFSFVLAQLCLDAGVITNYVYSMILGSALITIMLTPFIFALTSRLCARYGRPVEVAAGARNEASAQALNSAGQVVICGYGGVGSKTAGMLGQLSIPYTVVDLDPRVISELRQRRVPCIYGDASSREVLYEAGIKDAAILVLAVPNPMVVELALDYVRQINPDVDIIVCAHSNSELEFLHRGENFWVVQPEREAAIKVVRHILSRFDIPEGKLDKVLAGEGEAYSGKP